MINVQVIGISEQIKQVLESEGLCVSFYDDEVQALNAVEQAQPSVILLNYDVRGLETENYIKLLLNVSKNSKIVVLADELGDEGVLVCLIAGAKGYQEINQLNNYLVKIIKVIDAGEAWITRRMVAKLLDVLIQK